VWQGRVSNGLRRSRSMSYELLREQLQENLISYLSILEGVDLDDDKGSVLDDVCQIVVDTFKEVLV
jgi:hypothetical protein